MDDTIAAQLRKRKQDAEADRRAIVARCRAEGRTRLSDDEDQVFRTLGEQIDDIESRLEESDRSDTLRAGADRIFSAAKANQTSGKKSMSISESRVYNEATAREGRSFWADLVRMKSNDDADGSARRRLTEHAETEMRPA